MQGQSLPVSRHAARFPAAGTGRRDDAARQDDGGGRYDALDGLRGVAAACVMLGHLGQVLDFWWPAHMFLAVDVFFILSGFVIAHAYGERLRNGLPAWRYLSRRLVRLYPMFVAGLLIGAAGLYYGASRGAIVYRSGDIWRSVALNALYIPFFNTARIYQAVGQLFPADPPAWSLFLEVLASGGFLLLFDLRRRTLVLIAVLCYLALMGAGFYFARADGWVGFDISNGFDSHNILGGFPRVGFGFTLGVLLQSLARDGVGGRHAAAVLRRLRYPSFALYAVLIAMLLFPRTVRGVYPLLAVAVAAPAIVLLGAEIRCRRGLESSVARLLGWLSYPVYCLHLPVLRLVTFVHGGPRGATLLVAAGSAAVTLVLAVVLTKWYEEPVRAALSRRLSAAPPRRPRSALT